MGVIVFTKPSFIDFVQNLNLIVCCSSAHTPYYRGSSGNRYWWGILGKFYILEALFRHIYYVTGVAIYRCKKIC